MSLLDFTGKVKIINGIYYFEMRKKIDPLKCSTPTEVRNPVIDSTFKYVFLQNEEIIKNLLNSVIFTGEDEIKKLNYTRNEFPMLTGGKYGKDIKRIDVGVICKMGKKGNKERFISLNSTQKYASTILIDLEMQIDIFEEDYSERFIGYAAQIYASEKVDKVYVIALILNPNKFSGRKSKSSKTIFTEKSIPKFAIIKEYDYLTIIKIDLNYCYKLLEENKGIWILSSENILNRDGEEWIKYLTIPLWCNSYKGYHQFPNIVEKNFVENRYVLDALLILSNKNNDEFKKYYDEWSMYEKDQKLLEKTQELCEKDEIITEKDEIISKKDEEIERLKQENEKIKKEFIELKEKKQVIKSPKSKSSKYRKKSKKTSNIKTKNYKYPKKEINDEEEEESGIGEGEGEEEGEGEGEEEESKDSDYFPDKEDLEEEEKKEEDKDDDNSNKEEDMDIE